MVARDSYYDYRSLWRGRSYGYLRSCRSPGSYDCASGYGCPGGYGDACCHGRSGGAAANTNDPCARGTPGHRCDSGTCTYRCAH